MDEGNKRSRTRLAGPRFELGLTVPETVVLPLDDPAVSADIISFY